MTKQESSAPTGSSSSVPTPEETAAKIQDTAAGTQEAAPKAPTLSEIIREHATDDDAPQGSNLTLGKIIGGDILSAAFMRRQVWVMLLATFFIILYITNRYSCQRSLTEVDSLTRALREAKYRSLSSSSQLVEMTRESRVLERLQACKDSTLRIATQPPYIVNVPQEEQNHE